MFESFKLPFLFLFYLIIFTAILFSGAFLYKATVLAGINPNTKASLLNLPSLVISILPAACAISLIFLFFRILKKPLSRLLSFLLPLITASCCLIFGIWGLKQIGEINTVPLDNPEMYLKEKSFIFTKESALFIESLEGERIRNVLQINYPDSDYHISFLPEAEYFLDEDTFILRGNTSNISLQLEKRLKYDRLINKSSLEYIFNDFELFNQELAKSFNNDFTEFCIIAFSFIYLILTSSVFMRLSRWPLFNFLLILLTLKGALFLYSFIRKGFLNEFLNGFSGFEYLNLLPSIAFLAIGTLFLLVDILFVPFDFWVKEIESE